MRGVSKLQESFLALTFSSRKIVLAMTLVLTVVAVDACTSSPSDHSAHGDHQQEGGAYQRGPHKGRLLSSGDFTIELTIFEQGTPPHFRVYGYKNEVMLPSSDFNTSIFIKRLNQSEEKFQLEPLVDFLTSSQEVKEPHSFDVRVEATHKGQKYVWNFSSYEGRTTIPESIALRSGIHAERVVSRVIQTALSTRGKIVPSEHHVAHIIPRFSGVVKEGRKHIGDSVQKGEVLAVIESNQSLQPFEVRSQIPGVVINGHLIVGEFVPENQWVYVVADISEVWAEFSVPLRERARIEVGQRVLIRPLDSEQDVEGTIGYVSPYTDERTQSQIVRVVVPNTAGLFMPGMFVTARIITAEGSVPVAVKREAIQSFRDWQVVFLKVGDTYEVRPVELGRSDGDWIEVISGLSAGEEYVAENSFVIKADILKSGASHDH